jgi:hypothetical protein
MKRLELLVIFLMATSFVGWEGNFSHAAAALSNDQSEFKQTPVILCLPGVYLYDPGECTPAGPSNYLNQLASEGISLPLPPLPASPADPALANIDVQYGEVITPNAPIYATLEEAIQGVKKQAVNKLSGDTVYISYTQEESLNGKRAYMIDNGQWIKGADISRIGALPRFQGAIFSRTPTNAFGWVLSYFAPSAQIETKRTPGPQGDDYSGHFLNLYDIVPVFTEEKIGEETWYMVGPDEWVPQKYVARVIPNSTPPKGVDGDRWIEINLHDQTLAVYQNRQLVFATVIASGLEPFWTQPGLFQIYEKHDLTLMRGAFESDGTNGYYLEDVPWTMYYDQARALHGAYWRAKMGFPQSHGCVNLAVGDAHWLFDWANIGDWVYVWDPSGKTPTDPGLYGSGGY